MIVDTSALVAVLRREEGYKPILDALVREDSLLPAPVLVEFARVSAGTGNVPDPRAEALIATLLGARTAVLPLDAEGRGLRWQRTRRAAGEMVEVQC